MGSRFFGFQRLHLLAGNGLPSFGQIKNRKAVHVLDARRLARTPYDQLSNCLAQRQVSALRLLCRNGGYVIIQRKGGSHRTYYAPEGRLMQYD